MLSWLLARLSKPVFNIVEVAAMCLVYASDFRWWVSVLIVVGTIIVMTLVQVCFWRDAERIDE